MQRVVFPCLLSAAVACHPADVASDTGAGTVDAFAGACVISREWRTVSAAMPAPDTAPDATADPDDIDAWIAAIAADPDRVRGCAALGEVAATELPAHVVDAARSLARDLEARTRWCATMARRHRHVAGRHGAIVGYAVRVDLRAGTERAGIDLWLNRDGELIEAVDHLG